MAAGELGWLQVGRAVAVKHWVAIVAGSFRDERVPSHWNKSPG
jgi:hypothetical protein